MRQVVNTFPSSCLLFRRYIFLQSDAPHIGQARPLMEAIVKIRDFEKKIRDRDGITIVIRARKTANIRNYRESRANHTIDISDYIKNHLNIYMDNTYELSIIDGFGNEPTGGTSVGAIRESYRH
jgi:hypothetical protein